MRQAAAPIASVLRALWRLNVAEELQYRANFVASVLGTLFWLTTALLTVALFFSHTTRLGGWDFWEVAVLLGVFNTLSGVIEAVLRPGIGRLAEEVRKGTLDLVLARPVEPQFYISFRVLDVWRLVDVGAGLALAGYALVRLGRVPSALDVAAFAVTLLAAVASVAGVLWFPYVLAFPVGVLTGEVTDPAALARGFAGQLLWLAVWWGAYRLIWRRGRVRYGAVGG